jgi:hypothetical protein
MHRRIARRSPSEADVEGELPADATGESTGREVVDAQQGDVALGWLSPQILAQPSLVQACGQAGGLELGGHHPGLVLTV